MFQDEQWLCKNCQDLNLTRDTQEHTNGTQEQSIMKSIFEINVITSKNK